MRRSGGENNLHVNAFPTCGLTVRHAWRRRQVSLSLKRNPWENGIKGRSRLNPTPALTIGSRAENGVMVAVAPMDTIATERNPQLANGPNQSSCPHE